MSRRSVGRLPPPPFALAAASPLAVATFPPLVFAPFRFAAALPVPALASLPLLLPDRRFFLSSFGFLIFRVVSSECSFSNLLLALPDSASTTRRWSFERHWARRFSSERWFRRGTACSVQRAAGNGERSKGRGQRGLVLVERDPTKNFGTLARFQNTIFFKTPLFSRVVPLL